MISSKYLIITMNDYGIFTGWGKLKIYSQTRKIPVGA